MKILVYVGVATKEEQEQLIGVNTNRSLLNIQRDSFLRNNIEWSCDIGEVFIDFKPKNKKRVVLQDEQQAPEEGKKEPVVDLTKKETEKTGDIEK